MHGRALKYRPQAGSIVERPSGEINPEMLTRTREGPQGPMSKPIGIVLVVDSK